jgi:uncharacterized membrane-anchored protein
MARVVRSGLGVGVFVLALVFAAARSSAAEPESPEGNAERAEPGGPHPEIGPKKIDLGDDLVVDLPEGMAYVNRAEGKTLMEKLGNRTDDSFRASCSGATRAGSSRSSTSATATSRTMTRPI